MKTALAAALMLLLACGPGINGPELEKAVIASHLGPQVVAYDGTQLSQLLIFSVGASYLLTGQVHTTGTVTWQSLDAATYAASPSDKLVVINPQGGKAEFTVRTLTTTNPQSFFKGDWALDFHVTVANSFDLDLKGQSTGGQFSGTGKGTITADGHANSIDVASSGSTYFDNDSSGSEYRNNYHLTGTLKRDELVRTVDEQWTFRMVTSRYNNKTTSASDAVRVDNGSLTIAGDTIKWNDCRTAKAFTNGKPSQEDFWKAACQSITRNGQPFGQYRLESKQFGQSGGTIRMLADLGGQVIELEKWNAY